MWAKKSIIVEWSSISAYFTVGLEEQVIIWSTIIFNSIHLEIIKILQWRDWQQESGDSICFLSTAEVLFVPGDLNLYSV